MWISGTVSQCAMTKLHNVYMPWTGLLPLTNIERSPTLSPGLRLKHGQIGGPLSGASRVLEFIDAAEVATLPQQVMALFESAVGEFGFHAYIMAGIPTSDVSFDRVTIANGWPAEWFDLYVRDNLCAVDPIPRHALTTVHPFLWSEALYDREADSAARRVMERAMDFRFNSGFCIPIHYEAATAAVSMAGDRPYITDETKRALHIIGLYSHTRIRSLVRKKQPARLLSNNEAEVLRWAAIGKTAWETESIY